MAEAKRAPLQEPAAPPSGTEPQAAAPEPAAPPPPDEADESQVIKRRGPDPGWSPLSLKDELPICVFSSLEARAAAPQLKDVKPQKLAADSALTLGVYGPGCLNDACDDRPTLQCWIERESEDTFVVKSRFFSFHRDDSECTEDCMDLDTACWTSEPLKPGKYKIRHGDKTYKLRIPGVVRDPCFGTR